MALTPEHAAIVAVSIKKSRPDITEQELAALVKEAGELNDDPVKSQAFAAKILPQLNTELADPYKGTGYTSTDSLKQFNPEQMRDAISKYNQFQRAQAPSRYMANLGASMGDANGRAAVNDLLKNADELNMLNSVGGQEKLQSQAAAGINAAKEIKSMAEAAGKYSGTQIEQQQKLQTGQLTLDQQKRMNDPKSTETIIAKRMLASQLQSNPALANDPALKAVLSRPDVTAQMIMGIMDKNVLDAYKKQVGIVTDETKARTDQAVTQDLTGGTQPRIGVPPPSPPPAAPYVGNAGRGGQGGPGMPGSKGPLAWNGNPNNPNDTSVIKDSDRVNILKAELAKATNPADIEAIQREIARAGGTPTLTPEAKERMKYSSITGGGQTLVPNPVDVRKAEGAGKEAADFNERMRTYKNYVEPQIDTALTKLDSTSSGKGTEAVARLLPANEQQELVNMLAQVNNMYPGAVPPSIAGKIEAAQQAGGFTGSPLASLTTEQLRTALKMIKANTQREINYQQEKEKAEKGGGAGTYGTKQTTSPNPVPQRNNKGWSLHTDKNGNKAYVSPDGKQYEEVK